MKYFTRRPCRRINKEKTKETNKKKDGRRREREREREIISSIRNTAEA